MKKYIQTMYRPAYITLCLGLFVFCVSLVALAISLRQEILSGATDIIYRYPKMIEKILFPLYIFIPVVFLIDLNERQNKSWFFIQKCKS